MVRRAGAGRLLSHAADGDGRAMACAEATPEGIAPRLRGPTSLRSRRRHAPAPSVPAPAVRHERVGP